jgi:hypothetical protein
MDVRDAPIVTLFIAAILLVWFYTNHYSVYTPHTSIYGSFRHVLDHYNENHLFTNITSLLVFGSLSEIIYVRRYSRWGYASISGLFITLSTLTFYFIWENAIGSSGFIYMIISFSLFIWIEKIIIEDDYSNLVSSIIILSIISIISIDFVVLLGFSEVAGDIPLTVVETEFYSTTSAYAHLISSVIGLITGSILYSYKYYRKLVSISPF